MKHIILTMLAVMALSGCSPTVKVEAPDKPIVINMNVNISHEIRVKVDRDLDNSVFAKDSPLF